MGGSSDAIYKRLKYLRIHFASKSLRNSSCFPDVPVVCSESALNRQFPSPKTLLTFRLICSRNGSISSYALLVLVVLQVDLGVPLQEFHQFICTFGFGSVCR